METVRTTLLPPTDPCGSEAAVHWPSGSRDAEGCCLAPHCSRSPSLISKSFILEGCCRQGSLGHLQPWRAAPRPASAQHLFWVLLAKGAPGTWLPGPASLDQWEKQAWQSGASPSLAPAVEQLSSLETGCGLNAALVSRLVNSLQNHPASY